jgi:hypothetical protein
LWRFLLLALRSYLCGTQGKSHRIIIYSRAPGQNYSPALEALAFIALLMRATWLLTAAELDFLKTKLRCPRENLPRRIFGGARRGPHTKFGPCNRAELFLFESFWLEWKASPRSQGPR